jgi:hypothetical protein
MALRCCSAPVEKGREVSGWREEARFQVPNVKVQMTMSGLVVLVISKKSKYQMIGYETRDTDTKHEA